MRKAGPPSKAAPLIDERTNAIIVTATEAQIEAFRRIVAALDVPVRQVLIESRVITVNSNDAQRLGVRWGGGGIAAAGGAVGAHRRLPQDLGGVAERLGGPDQGPAPSPARMTWWWT